MKDALSNPLVRAGLRIADWSERWFPDAFVFALVAVFVAFGGGLAAGESPLRLVEVFGG
ncbi:short-chain fatty acid transporter, partial [candidate division KSB1 bacterium]|nr:short-chain fatty acid transporter [candidate division KSB1 bacterium]